VSVVTIVRGGAKKPIPLDLAGFLLPINRQVQELGTIESHRPPFRPVSQSGNAAFDSASTAHHFKPR
jgi:hypothetical protein